MGSLPRLEGSAYVTGRERAFATRLYSTVADCWTLTEPEVTFLIALKVLTTADKIAQE